MNEIKKPERGNFSTRIGFIMAAAGSAVGLGNLWKFPYITWTNGGGLFVLVYLVCVVLVGLPIMISEIAIGKLSQKDPVGAFKALGGASSPFRLVGILGVLSGFVILSYYSVVAGWSIEYTIKAAQDEFKSVPRNEMNRLLSNPQNLLLMKQKAFTEAIEAQETDSIKYELLKDAKIIDEKKTIAPEMVNLLYKDGLKDLASELKKNNKLEFWQDKFFTRHELRVDHVEWMSHQLLPVYSKSLFSGFLEDKSKTTLWHTVFMLMTLAIVIGGIHKGIEKFSKYLMPALLLMMIFMVMNSLMLDKEQEGIKFLLYGDSSKFNALSVLQALGHAFFTLSLGMGAMMTYGSYMSSKENVIRDSLWVTGFDTFIAILACMIIFPILFVYDMNPKSSSIGMLFTAIPLELHKLNLGYLMTIVFYILVFVAAITSAISLLEVVVSYLSDEMGLNRKKAALTAAGLIFAAGIPSALSGDFLGMADMIASTFMLPFGGLCIALFTGFKMDMKLIRQEFVDYGFSENLFRVFYFTIRYITPVLVLAVFAYSVAGIWKE